MTIDLLHISSSPRGTASESLRIAEALVDAYRDVHPGAHIQTWDLWGRPGQSGAFVAESPQGTSPVRDDGLASSANWDGSLPEFGPDAAAAKMAVFGGAEPEGSQARAWQAALDTFARFDAVDRVLFSVPMWNGGVPYILKQFIDVVSQPGAVFSVDPQSGYRPLLAGRGKKAAVVYTSAVWGPCLGPEFGRDFQSTYFTDWLHWTGIEDVSEIRFHPTLTGDWDQARREAILGAGDLGKRF